MYRLCQLGQQAEAPELRYALVAALEAVAHELFKTVLEVALRFEQDTGRKLLYLGPHHFEREPGHLTHQTDAADALLREAQLDAETAAEANRIAMAVCDLIGARWQEFLVNARACTSSRQTSNTVTCQS